MKSLVIHPESGLTLDFNEPDFGGAAQAAIIADWEARRAAGRRRLADPGEFICHIHRNHQHPDMYLRKDEHGRIIAAHWPGSGLHHQIAHVVSDEHHHRQVDYLQRAGEAEGYRVATEVHLPNVTPDAVIYGPYLDMGVEVQRSSITTALARARTTKARNAGVDSVWFSDGYAAPSWLGKVSGVGMNPTTSWASLPQPRTVTVVAGVREVVTRRCRDWPGSQCPRHRYGCNQLHPDHVARPVWVDDLAAYVPAGQLVPMVFRTFSGRADVFIVTPADKARYEDMTGRSADLPGSQRAGSRRQQPGRIECAADAGGLVPAAVAAELVVADSGGLAVPADPGALAVPAPPVPCPAHLQWPDSPWRCEVPGCPGRDTAAVP